MDIGLSSVNSLGLSSFGAVNLRTTLALKQPVCLSLITDVTVYPEG